MINKKINKATDILVVNTRNAFLLSSNAVIHNIFNHKITWSN